MDDYDPLPLTRSEYPEVALYNAPSSPDLPSADLTEFNFDEDGSTLPVGAARPRFVGPALYNETGAPQLRNSLLSSNSTTRSGDDSDYPSSIYPLNDLHGTRNPFDEGYRDDPAQRFLADEPALPTSALQEKREAYIAPRKKSRRIFLLISIGVGLIVLLAVVVALYFTVIKSKKSGGSPTGGLAVSSSSVSSSPKSTSSAGQPSVKVAITGGDGSTVTMDDGSTFIYSNKFGGTWYWDENDPFNNNAQAQSWSPPLNQSFAYGQDKIWGVNLGGWLVTEPFIAPALFEPYLSAPTPAVDEWTLTQNMAADTANGGLSQLETHYRTFITERDFAQIAGAGLNFVRIPLAYWAIETWSGEPFLANVSWTYFLKAINWARKYGLRINLDLHCLPGSQNGWNHSGKLGTTGVLNGVMGLANAQRSLDYIRIIAEFVSQPQYRDVVTIFGITNEPLATVVGQDVLSTYYLQAYKYVRGASGIGEGKGPYISYHDGFLPRSQWAGFLEGADRITLDSHPYLCFGTQSSNDISTYATTPCSSWGSAVNTSMGAFGLTTAGEFSNAVTDCGKWVNGVGQGQRYDGTYIAGGPWPNVGKCNVWTDWQNYSPATKSAIQTFAMASMDSLQNWFFWTWKVGNSSISGTVESPAWSYQLGLENGWMPQDPRGAVGACQNSAPWVPPLSAWQTGGSGAGTFAQPTPVWPPPSISNGGAVTALPSYTPTGAVPTLTGATFTGTATVNVGDGWQDPSDTAGAMTGIATCSYLNPWVAPSAPAPLPLCSAAPARRGEQEAVPASVMTPAP